MPKYEMPRSEEHQRKRDELAEQIGEERGRRDTERKQSKKWIERGKAALGFEYAGERADSAEARAKELLQKGKKELEPLERAYGWQKLETLLKSSEDHAAHYPHSERYAEKMWQAMQKDQDLINEGLQDPEKISVILNHLSWMKGRPHEAAGQIAAERLGAWLDKNFDLLGLLADQDKPEARKALITTLLDQLKTEQKERALTMLNAHYETIEQYLTSSTATDTMRVRDLLGLALREGSPHLKEKIFHTAKQVFSKRLPQGESLWRLLFDCVGKDSNESEALEKAFISAAAEAYDLDSKSLIDSWRQSGHTGEKADHLFNLVALECRQPGVAKQLERDFGIRAFGRYPLKFLLKQAKDSDRKDKPYGVIIMARSDHSGAFHKMRDRWDELDQDIGDTFALRVVEAGTTLELGKRILSLDKHYGNEQKISFAIINGHGEAEEVKLGADVWRWQMSDRTEFEHDTSAKKHRLTKSDFLGTGFRRAKHLFVEHPTLIFFSCSTGAPEGIAQEVSKLYGAEVIAPDRPAHLERMRASVFEGRAKFEIKLNVRDSGQTMRFSP